MSEARPNVLFLLSDQHSGRYLSRRYDSDPPVRTPTFDGLAASGTSFEQTYCPYPLCTPSRMSLLTGREAQRCGAWENWHMLPEGIPTLPESFSDAGYETCLVGKMHLGGDRQFVGFDERPYGDLTGMHGHQSDPPLSYWEERDSSGLRGEPGVTGIPESLLQERNTVEEGLSFVREHAASDAEDPWFLCASFSRPHAPFTSPSRYAERRDPDEVPDPEVWPEPGIDHPAIEPEEGEDVLEVRRQYFACIDYLDEIVGDFLALLDRSGHLENTVVVYASDHGSMAGEHGQTGKKVWYEESTRVPFTVQLPGQRSGDVESASVETPVSLVDLFPTLCRLCDVPVPTGLDGVDLSEAVRTGEEPDRGPVVSDYLSPSLDMTEYRMVRDGRYKYVYFPDHEDLLFDLEADPHERTDLSTDAAGEDAAALDRLREYVSETIDFDVVRAARRRDEEQLTEHQLGGPGARTPLNAYHLPDGRVVDAGTPLYAPQVVAEEPSQVFRDWPGHE